jgi:TIR domain
MPGPKKIFISYNQKDVDQALELLHKLQKIKGYEVWFDRHNVPVGSRIADKIHEGLGGSDYYLILISENSNKSEWVKREISLAFDLSMKKSLTLVPVLLDSAEVPLEFRGLLHIDASKDFEAGLKKLIGFFDSQTRSADSVGGVGREGRAPVCTEELGKLPLGDLRFLITNRLSMDDVAVLWFDIFHSKMTNEVEVRSLPQCCVELIDRSRREELLIALIAALCRNHPRLGELAKA